MSVVDVRDPSALLHLKKIKVGNDPTPQAVRKGRIAFMNAFASSNDTFSCESCHPDGNMDQLLWRIGGACFFGACSGDDELRTTMPVRGLTARCAPWDGTPATLRRPQRLHGTAGNLSRTARRAQLLPPARDASLPVVLCDNP